MFDMSWLQNLLGGLGDPAKLDLLATEAATQMDPGVMLPAFGQAKDSMAQLAQQVAQPGAVPPSGQYGVGPMQPNAQMQPVNPANMSLGDLLQMNQPGDPASVSGLTPTQRAAMTTYAQEQPAMDPKAAMLALAMMKQGKGGAVQAAPPAASASTRGGSPMVSGQGMTAPPFTQNAGMPSLAMLLRGR